ncbi:hypothetical protein N7453_010135 [Penicillium expansum]|nr:hypothetical protein N7453_010135 [Penicillium expansum]
MGEKSAHPDYLILVASETPVESEESQKKKMGTMSGPLRSFSSGSCRAIFPDYRKKEPLQRRRSFLSSLPSSHYALYSSFPLRKQLRVWHTG